MTLGHLKAGVTPEQAAADFNSISADLERSYPKDHRHKKLSLARPSLYGDYLGGPVRAFLTALMLLAALILLAACANLGSLFAARAADRSREIALRLALGAGRVRILRQLFTEAMLISLIGGALGLWGSVSAVALVEFVAAISAISHQCPGEPRRKSLWSSLAVGSGERIPLWRGSRKAGAAHGSI